MDTRVRTSRSGGMRARPHPGEQRLAFAPGRGEGSGAPQNSGPPEAFMPSRFRRIVLRASGVLLVVLGALHLAVTPFITRFVEQGASPDAVDWLTPPMLLNHILVGILLLPLGILVFYSAQDAAAGASWALMVSRTIALTVAALPLTLFLLVGTRYFAAVPFLVATIVVCVASAALLAAAFSPVRNWQEWLNPRS